MNVKSILLYTLIILVSFSAISCANSGDTADLSSNGDDSFFVSSSQTISDMLADTESSVTAILKEENESSVTGSSKEENKTSSSANKKEEKNTETNSSVITENIYLGTENFDREMGLEILDLINQQRKKEGKQVLTYCKELEKAADIRAYECSVYWSHTRPSGKTFDTALKETGVTGIHAGENLCKYPSDSQSVFDGVMNSDSHRTAMLDGRYNYAVVSVYINESNGRFVALELLQK